MMDQMRPILEAGLEKLGLDTGAVPALTEYARLLLETNQVMNLTAITDPKDVATLHFLDCASLLTLADFSGKTVADVGSGAGFPGLPLKILCPSIQLTMVDSLGKRVNFLQTVCDALHLTGAESIHARAEEFAASHRAGFDIVTSRAVAALPVLAELCLPLVKEGGWFLAMKSVDSDAETAAAAMPWRFWAAAWKRPRTTSSPAPTCATGCCSSKKRRKRRKNIPGRLQKSKRIRYNKILGSLRTKLW